MLKNNDKLPAKGKLPTKKSNWYYNIHEPNRRIKSVYIFNQIWKEESGNIKLNRPIYLSLGELVIHSFIILIYLKCELKLIQNKFCENILNLIYHNNESTILSSTKIFIKIK